MAVASEGVSSRSAAADALLTQAWLTESAARTIDVQYFLFVADNVGSWQRTPCCVRLRRQPPPREPERVAARSAAGELRWLDDVRYGSDAPGKNAAASPLSGRGISTTAPPKTLPRLFLVASRVPG